MNHSIATADRDTHFKIVALAVIAAMAVFIVGINARVDDSGLATVRFESRGPVIKAGTATQFTTRSGIEIR
jgi:hypothetical protein